MQYATRKIKSGKDLVEKINKVLVAVDSFIFSIIPLLF